MYPKLAVYVADTGNYRIQVFDAEGNYILDWGTQTGGDGGFLRPSGLTVTSTGRINVLDTTIKRIQTFSSITE